MESLMTRRTALGLAGAAWLTPLATQLARAAETRREPARSLIILWMQGGPSQLETFDPHPESKNSGGTKAIHTSVKGIQLAEGLPLVAEQMESIALVRSMTSKEGDHERGTSTLKTGFRPDPTVVHPSSQWPARGGYLGDHLDAFLMDDPAGPVPNTKSFLPTKRDEQRLKDLDVVESAFAKGRRKTTDGTLHRQTVADARKMMSSEQLKAFDVSQEPAAVRKMYGDTPFGRGCLAARRLVEVGVRCIEVTLAGWDTHVNNHSFCKTQNSILDPAFAALIRDLKERKLLDHTLVVCGGEFGRTPSINPGGGRDHWPTGFSYALAGGGVRGGQVIGETNPDAAKDNKAAMLMMAQRGGVEKFVKDEVTVENLSATLLHALGIEYDKLGQTPIGRTVKFSNGQPVKKLLAKG
jgi:uncharacterized protein (DUF1501 family)